MLISDWSSDVCSSDLYKTLGIDIEDQGFPNTMEKNYLEVRKSHIRQKPSLVIMNPPFNRDSKTKEYIKPNHGGRPLVPEVWFQKARQLYGTIAPIALVTPHRCRLRRSDNGSRWKEVIEEEYTVIEHTNTSQTDSIEALI